jgi:HSP20 family protein
MALERWRPIRELRRWRPTRMVPWFEEDLDEMLERFERMFGTPLRRTLVETRGWLPVLDMVDRKDEIVVRAELPGIKKEDLHVSVTGDTLTIEGERKMEEAVEEEDYYCCERSYGRFYRELILPSNVDREKIASKFEEGVLEIRMPKTEEVKPKEIEIQVK